MRILIVEDDPVLASLESEMLEDAGHVIVGPAYNAKDALRIAGGHPIDVAFVDINLGAGEDGIQVAQSLRELYGTRTLLVSSQISAARARGQGTIGLLSKPYSLDDLVTASSIVKAWLAGETLNIPIPRTLEIFRARIEE